LVQPNQFESCHQIAAVAAEVKKAAKKIPGSSLYIDSRAGSLMKRKALAA
jgi:hypothetical protein